MKSLALIGLAGLAAKVQAHPTFHEDTHGTSLSKRAIDLSQYAMPPVSNYSPSSATKDNKAAKTVGKRSSYVETATEFITKEVPGLEFRVVDDHYIGSGGVAHIHFKQTHHGIDIDNADFNVNVSSSCSKENQGMKGLLTALCLGRPGWQDLFLWQQFLHWRAA
jgi:extracellular elastinolytic metalloproteinase